MAKYAVLFSYTRESWAQLKGTSAEDFPKPFHTFANAVGGSVDGFWLMHGAYDGFATLDLPDSAAAAVVRVGLTATGSFDAVEVEELIGLDALAGPLQQLGSEDIW